MNGCRFWRLTQSGEWRMVSADLIPALPPPWAIEALWTAAGSGIRFRAYGGFLGELDPSGSHQGADLFSSSRGHAKA